MKPQISEGDNLARIKQERLLTIKKLRALGIDPYPAEATRTHVIGQVLNSFDNLARAQVKVFIAGRVRACRVHGKITFFDVADESGKIQVLVREPRVGRKRYGELIPLIDSGDFLEVGGFCIVTKSGEKSIEALSLKILCKSIFPLPKEWYGLKDKEEQYRKRYLDLLCNEDHKKRFYIRSKIIKTLRQLLDQRGFIEVETPILQRLYGGANAKPFKTRLNALKMDLFLRIAPELYLKQLVVGGFEGVFEIGKNFRNEGIDKFHNPEFTSLELYWAYHNYIELMKFTEEIISEMVKSVQNTTIIEYQGKKIDFRTPWRRVKFLDVFVEKVGLDPLTAALNELKKQISRFRIKLGKKVKRDTLIDELYKKVVVKNITEPTYIYDIPTFLSPLAKSHINNPAIAQRFQGYVAGVEIINAFSELNDPVDQENRFKQEQNQREDPHPIDKDFIEALSFGMPPCAGLGIGIDRLSMILSQVDSIRDIIFFPFMRVKKD